MPRAKAKAVPTKRARRGKLHAVVLAGGAGERFWPASRRARPKPFLEVLEGRSLLEKDGDMSAMKAAIERIQQASHKMAEVMYQSATAGAPGGAPPGAGPFDPSATPPGADQGPTQGADDDVIDAEYEENK